MSEDHAAVPTKMFGVVLAAACAVVVWKVVALVLLSSHAETSHESLGFELGYGTVSPFSPYFLKPSSPSRKFLQPPAKTGIDASGLDPSDGIGASFG